VYLRLCALSEIYTKNGGGEHQILPTTFATGVLLVFIEHEKLLDIVLSFTHNRCM
jgi:hypothetical protein